MAAASIHESTPLEEIPSAVVVDELKIPARLPSEPEAKPAITRVKEEEDYQKYEEEKYELALSRLNEIELSIVRNSFISGCG